VALWEAPSANSPIGRLLADPLQVRRFSRLFYMGGSVGMAQAWTPLFKGWNDPHLYSTFGMGLLTRVTGDIALQRAIGQRSPYEDMFRQYDPMEVRKSRLESLIPDQPTLSSTTSLGGAK
jgi:hypothetical protein